MNFVNFFASKINAAKIELNVDNNIIVVEEQAFVKFKELEPKTIYVIVKILASSIAYDGKIQPIQLMVISEANSQNIANAVMNKFATDNNLVAETIGSDLVKQTYNTPVVVSNFTEIGYGFNSVIYVSGTLFVLESILDIQDLTIDDNSIKVTSFNLSYAMTGNTQPIPDNKIATTVKSVSTVSCSFVIPMISTYSTFIDKVLGIMKGETSGNSDFEFNFTISNIEFKDVNMKLISATFTSAPNSAPGLQVGFME